MLLEVTIDRDSAMGTAHAGFAISALQDAARRFLNPSLVDIGALGPAFAAAGEAAVSGTQQQMGNVFDIMDLIADKGDDADVDMLT